MIIKEFEQKIKVIEDYLEQIESLGKILEVEGIILLGTKLIDEYVKTLSEQINDKGDWVNWYIWENNFGKNKLAVFINDKKIIVNNASKLFKIINSREN